MKSKVLKTPYRLNVHTNDVGNTICLGLAGGAGKSTILALIASVQRNSK